MVQEGMTCTHSLDEMVDLYDAMRRVYYGPRIDSFYTQAMVYDICAEAVRNNPNCGVFFEIDRSDTPRGPEVSNCWCLSRESKCAFTSNPDQYLFQIIEPGQGKLHY